MADSSLNQCIVFTMAISANWCSVGINNALIFNSVPNQQEQVRGLQL